MEREGGRGPGPRGCIGRLPGRPVAPLAPGAPASITSSWPRLPHTGGGIQQGRNSSAGEKPILGLPLCGSAAVSLSFLSHGVLCGPPELLAAVAALWILPTVLSCHLLVPPANLGGLPSVLLDPGFSCTLSLCILGTQMVPHLLPLLDDPKPLIRSITCWTLSRYSKWIVQVGPLLSEGFFGLPSLLSLALLLGDRAGGLMTPVAALPGDSKACAGQSLGDAG